MKIGVFDSGVGGLLVASLLRRRIPHHQIICRTDYQHFPYGNKSEAEILARSLVLTSRLVDLGCKLVVVACNSATTTTISSLRQRFPLTVFVGIEPPVKPISKMTRTGKVAIMGTAATINSRQYLSLTKEHAGGIKIYGVACAGLADLIEKQVRRRETVALFKPQIIRLVKQYLDPVVTRGVDVIGIACTHYPYLLRDLRQMYPGVIFYDPALAVLSRVSDLVE